MKKIILLIILLLLSVFPVKAMEYEPPTVPDSGEEYMPEDTESFGEGIWFIIKSATADLLPEISKTATSCYAVFAIMLLVSMIDSFSEASGKTVHLASSVMIGFILLNPTNTLIQMGVDTMREMSEYGKLLIPVLSTALAAQGGVSSSSALYMTTAIFGSTLITLVTKISVPLLYIYFCLVIVSSALEDELILNIQNFVKWLITWSLKIMLYVFTGFIGITGVVSGTADASAVKAMKLTISGMIPVVGGIISDASETILISAGVMKNTAGIYGILAIIAVFIGPFLKIGCQYLMLKITASVCSVFSGKTESQLLKSFSGGMGMLLGMTGSVCLFLLIACVCFLKGVS